MPSYIPNIMFWIGGYTRCYEASHLMANLPGVNKSWLILKVSFQGFAAYIKAADY